MKVDLTPDNPIARKLSYPEIGDQLDAIYKTFKHLKNQGIDIGLDGDAWVKSVEDIKDKFPKQ